ncbi:MAG: hypothetical protein IPO60_18120 [Flavobacteriales bacterium]|nr:hypothetical protein [Flavobacteriales bacterium]
MPVHAIAKRKVKDADWLPRSAVVSSDGAGRFCRRRRGLYCTKRPGRRTLTALVQVLGGNKPAERVAANGQFLADSESLHPDHTMMRYLQLLLHGPALGGPAFFHS